MPLCFLPIGVSPAQFFESAAICLRNLLISRDRCYFALVVHFHLARCFVYQIRPDLPQLTIISEAERITANKNDVSGHTG